MAHFRLLFFWIIIEWRLDILGGLGAANFGRIQSLTNTTAELQCLFTAYDSQFYDCHTGINCMFSIKVTVTLNEILVLYHRRDLTKSRTR